MDIALSDETWGQTYLAQWFEFFHSNKFTGLARAGFVYGSVRTLLDFLKDCISLFEGVRLHVYFDIMIIIILTTKIMLNLQRIWKILVDRKEHRQVVKGLMVRINKTLKYYFSKIIERRRGIHKIVWFILPHMHFERLLMLCCAWFGLYY